MKNSPSLDDFDRRLRSFGAVDTEIGNLPSVHTIGALSLKTSGIKNALRQECSRWKITFSDNLHLKAKDQLEKLSEFIRSNNGKVTREVKDLDSLRFIMGLLVMLRERESSMEMEINPIMVSFRFKHMIVFLISSFFIGHVPHA
jgi:dynein heavy chain, axonemal